MKKYINKKYKQLEKEFLPELRCQKCNSNTFEVIGKINFRFEYKKVFPEIHINDFSSEEIKCLDCNEPFEHTTEIYEDLILVTLMKIYQRKKGDLF